MPAKETLHYGAHALQTITVTHLPHNPSGYWLIFIHGGAWRDPLQTSTNFTTPLESLLLQTPTPDPVTAHLAGLASISYRLSPHPSFPQNPQDTDPRELREAKHPEHIADVQAALECLQEKLAFRERYIFVGHSCGATMAFQSVMGSSFFSSSSSSQSGFDVPVRMDLPKPVGILGTAGIYDLRLLRDTYRDRPEWQEFIEGAFGNDEGVWDTASPAKVGGSAGVQGGWGAGKVAVLAHSPEDGLVDASQGEAMRWALTGWEREGRGGRRVVMLPVKGQHDDVWEKGEELARAVTVTVEEVRKLELAS